MKKHIDKSLPTQEQLAQIRPQLRNQFGRRVLRSIFVELFTKSAEDTGNVESFFTTKDHNIVKDGKTYWSLKNIYFSYEHIPGFEYEFAMDVFGDWDHWLMLADSAEVRDIVTSWREELVIKVQAKAMKAMMKTAIYEGSKGIPAAKWLADRGWEVKRGRPSKEEVARERKIAAGISTELAEDMERLGLTVVKGGK